MSTNIILSNSSVFQRFIRKHVLRDFLVFLVIIKKSLPSVSYRLPNNLRSKTLKKNFFSKNLQQEYVCKVGCGCILTYDVMRGEIFKKSEGLGPQCPGEIHCGGFTFLVAAVTKV